MGIEPIYLKPHFKILPLNYFHPPPTLIYLNHFTSIYRNLLHPNLHLHYIITLSLHTLSLIKIKQNEIFKNQKNKKKKHVKLKHVGT